MNVSVHPTIMKTKMMELVMNVLLLVKNAQFQQIIVMIVQLIESKELNQTAHAQLDNSKTRKVFVKIVHTDVIHVMEILIIVMEKNVLTKPELWTNVSVFPDTLKLLVKSNVKNVKTSVKHVQPLPTNVMNVLKEELILLQNAHAHPDNGKIQKKFAKIVIINVKNVKVQLIPVPNVPMQTDNTPSVIVPLDGMTLELKLVDNVYQNVPNVIQDTTVLFVLKKESKDQKEIAHAQMDNTNSNITVMIVTSNVKLVKPWQESVQNVKQTEKD